MSGKINLINSGGYNTEVVAGNKSLDTVVSLDDSVAFKNAVVNGGFEVNQGINIDTAPVTIVNDTIYIDRGIFEQSGGAGTIQRTDTILNGEKVKSLQFIAVDGGTSSYTYNQKLNEVFAGQSVTFSCWLRTNSPIFAVAVDLTHSTGGGSNWFNGDLNTWSLFTYTVAVPITNTSLKFRIRFSGNLGVGNYLEVANVQIEKGTIATEFEKRPYDLEKILCGQQADNEYGYVPNVFSKPVTGIKNILINGDLNINHYADINTAPVAMVGGDCQINRFESTQSVLSGEIQRFSSQVVNGREVSTVKTTATSTAIGLLGITQRVENFHKGEQLTAGAWVKSNYVGAYVSFYDGVTWNISSSHTGSDSWEFLSVTGIVDASATELSVYVGRHNGFGNPVSIDTGRYVETTMIQLEAGAEVTDFEHRPEAIELSMCQRYYRVNNTGLHVEGNAGVINEYRYNFMEIPDMRVTPTVTSVAGAASNVSTNSLSAMSSSSLRYIIRAVAVGRFYGGVDSYTLDAEL